MTSTELATFKKVMPNPFAGGPNAEDDRMIEIPYQVPSSVRNYPVDLDKGFHIEYDSPVISGGATIDRTLLNGLFNLMTRDAAYRQAGGIYTFDSALSNIIGGYPKDAILQYLDIDGVLHFVRSLQDNNTFDFTVSGIDNLHWAKCLPNEVAANVPVVDWGSAASSYNQLFVIGHDTFYETGATKDTWVLLDSGAFSRNGYIYTAWDGNIIVGPGSSYNNSTLYQHHIYLCITGNTNSSSIAGVNPDTIRANPQYNATAFEIATLSRYIDGSSNWTSNFSGYCMIPCNAYSNYALWYKLTTSTQSTNLLANNGVIANDSKFYIRQQILN